MIVTKEKQTAEQQRIEASNAKRELDRHRGYTIELRGDVYATQDTAKRLRAEADELESGLEKRIERLRVAEEKLAKMETKQ